MDQMEITATLYSRTEPGSRLLHLNQPSLGYTVRNECTFILVISARPAICA